MHNLLRMLTEDPITADREAGHDAEGIRYSPSAIRSLRRLPTLIGAVYATLGPAHWTVSALLESQLDAWVEIAVAHAPPAAAAAEVAAARLCAAPPAAGEGDVPSADGGADGGGDGARPAAWRRAERRALASLRDDAGRSFDSASAMLRSIWALTEQLWELRAQRGEFELWENLSEVLGVLSCWGLRAVVVSGAASGATIAGAELGISAAKGPEGASGASVCHLPPIERAMRMLELTRRQAELEYGDDSEDGAALRKLEHAVAAECGREPPWLVSLS